MATNRSSRQAGDRNGKEVTRYTFADIIERGVPETGHTDLLPEDETVVSVPMDDGWTRAMEVGHLPEAPDQGVLVDMDPTVDPVLFWAGKRNLRKVSVLPLQRNEIVTESRIAQIVDRVRAKTSAGAYQPSLFAEMEKALREGEKERRAEWFTHDEGWKNKLICGDSLQVMESLIQHEGLRGKAQMIYVDPPYGIKYNSNFQQRIDSTHNDDKDLADDVVSIKAFRDTWALGIHSYLSYLQERLYLARELLTDRGSVFVQISDENAHLVRAVLDEVFGKKNFVAQILFRKTGGLSSAYLNGVGDYLLWYAKSKDAVFFRQVYRKKLPGEQGATQYRFRLNDDGTVRELDDDELALTPDSEIIAHDNITSQGNPVYPFTYRDRLFRGPFKPPAHRLQVLADMGRLCIVGNTLRYVRRLDDFPWFELNQLWEDTGVSGFGRRKVYVVQTSDLVVERCMLMTTKPGDLILDPTLGSGTSALVAEKLGRRWIGIDSSRVAVNVARRELLTSVFPSYRLKGAVLVDDFQYQSAKRVTMSSVIDGKEPEHVDLYDKPVLDQSGIRVTGPFEVMSLGRYSAEDWKGYVNESGTLENYIAVIARLYRKDAAIQSGTGFVHAVAENERERIAISIGPLSGRVTPKQIQDAVHDAAGLGIGEVHVLGWAFEANVGEIVSQLEERGNTTLRLVMIRPDTLADGLKITRPEMLFSPVTLPDVEVSVAVDKQGERRATVTLKGVGLFDRKHRSTDYHPAGDGYVAAWYLDEDYDGDCFVDCQMFFDFAKAPNLKAALKADVDPEEYKLQLTSHQFAIERPGQRVAIKVVDVYGNEATVVRDLA